MSFNNKNFLKGFYGRPWTLDQRKDLFIKLQEWGMNSYLYAPKDDYKHVILSFTNYLLLTLKLIFSISCCRELIGESCIL